MAYVIYASDFVVSAAKYQSFLICIIALTIFAFILGCSSSTTAVCGDNLCSEKEFANCSCPFDCGETCSTPPNSNPAESSPTVVASIPIPVTTTEIDLSVLLSSVDLSAITIPALSVSGSIELPSKEDYVRVLLVDGDGKEYLVFEAYYPLYSVGSTSFDSICNETCNLGKINPKRLKIETNVGDLSKIKFTSVTISSGEKRSQKESAVQAINSNLQKNNETWVAGETSVSKLSYSEKKAMFGDGSAAQPPGFEYYSEGVYGSPSVAEPLGGSGSSSSGSSATSLPSRWDWRQRHGKDWITPVRDQGKTGLCWAFASAAAVEAEFNLYYNSQLGFDLAEKEFYCGSFNQFYFNSITYGYGSTSSGGYPYQWLLFSKKTGVVDESCLPFSLSSSGTLDYATCNSALSVNCSGFTLTNGNCAITDTNCAACKNKDLAGGTSACAGKPIYSIGGFAPVGSDNFSAVTDMNVLKTMLITKGPLILASSYYYAVNPSEDITIPHATLLVGYETDSQGRTILVMKNSWGSDWGEDGYFNAYVPTDAFQVFYVTSPFIKSGATSPAVRCADDDNDTYCNWGLGSKPATCPSSCGNNSIDCDDSNPGLLGFDVNKNCVNVNSGTLDFNSNPDAAEVWVDGNYRGKTPLSLDLVAGSHKILIKKNEYKVYASLVDVNKFQNALLSVTLERDSKLLWKDTDPFGNGGDTYLAYSTIHARILVEKITSDAEKFYVYFKGSPSSDSNHYYTIKSAYVCQRASDLNCIPSTLKQITFSGNPSVMVNEGISVKSDLVDLALGKEKDYLILFMSTGYPSVLVSPDPETQYPSIDNYYGYAVSTYDTNMLKYVTYTDSRSFTQSIYGLEKIYAYSSASECGNGTCEDDEIYSTCSFDCPSTKQCLNTDSCCASNAFKQSGTICEQSVSTEFSCDTNKLMQRAYNKVCSGASSDCTQRAYSSWDLNTTCAQTCRSDTNSCSNYECWPFGKDENAYSGTTLGLCEQEIKKRICASGTGTWGTWSIIQAGVLSSTEACDANLFDEDCDGASNEGCACIDGQTQSCTIQSECGVGQQTCVSGAWSTCQQIAGLAPNTACGGTGSGKVCDASGSCVVPACKLTSECVNDNLCKTVACISPNDWNATCVLTNKTVNSSCGTGKSCSDTASCVTISCFSDLNCSNSNSCQTGTCSSAGLWTSSCAYTNKTEYLSCAQKSFCVSGACTIYSSPIYNPSTFNGTSAPANVFIDNNSVIDRNYFGVKVVAIKSSSGTDVASFDHNFSSSDLNLLGATVESGAADSNKNYLIVKGLVIQGTKTVYLPKRNSSSNAICVSNSEVPDLNNLISTCTRMPCPGTLSGISCAVVASSFAVSGLSHSGVVEDYMFCGDGNCNNNETCSSCASDCGACPLVTPPSTTIACSFDSNCGSSAFVGTKFCSGNDVRQVYRDWNCISKGTTSSRCQSIDSNKTVETCSGGKTCVSGACVSDQNAGDGSCVSDNDCAFDEECASDTCEKISCNNDYSPKDHGCVCIGKTCAGQCYDVVGICCNNVWKAGESSCIVSGAGGTDTNNADSNNSGKDSNISIVPGGSGIAGIAMVGGVILVFIVIIILVLVFSQKPPKTTGGVLQVPAGSFQRPISSDEKRFPSTPPKSSLP
ncbi:MAG: C1 family peptidase [archaeon]